MNKSDPLTSPAKSPSAQAALTRLGPGLAFKGDLSGSGDAVIEGRFEGTIALPGASLTIAREARVEADIVAADVEIAGTLSGDVEASGRIAVVAQAKIDGNLTAARVAIQDGAQFKGSIKINRPAVG